jgi:hypothetical protein
MKTAIVPVLAFGMVAQASALDWNTLRNNTVTGNLNDGVAAIGYTSAAASSGFINGALIQKGVGRPVIRRVVNGKMSETGPAVSPSTEAR